MRTTHAVAQPVSLPLPLCHPGDQGSNPHGRNFLFHVSNCEVLGSSPSFAPFFFSFAHTHTWARFHFWAAALCCFWPAYVFFFCSVTFCIFQCMHIYRKCHCFVLLITKYACIQIKQTIYVKCLEFYLVSQYPTFIHVKIFKIAVCINLHK